MRPRRGSTDGSIPCNDPAAVGDADDEGTNSRRCDLAIWANIQFGNRYLGGPSANPSWHVPLALRSPYGEIEPPTRSSGRGSLCRVNASLPYRVFHGPARATKLGGWQPTSAPPSCLHDVTPEVTSIRPKGSDLGKRWQGPSGVQPFGTIDRRRHCVSRRPPTQGDVGIFLEDGVGGGTACTGAEVGGWLDKDHPLRVRGSTPVSVYGPHYRTALTAMEEPSIRRAPLLSSIRSGPAAHPRIPAREVRIGDYLDSGGRGHPYPVLRAGHHFSTESSSWSTACPASWWEPLACPAAVVRPAADSRRKRYASSAAASRYGCRNRMCRRPRSTAEVLSLARNW